MLLLKSHRTLSYLLGPAHTLVAISPISLESATDAHNVERANDLAVTARTKGFGLMVLECQFDGIAERQLFVVAVGNESQVVGFARKNI